MHLTLASSVFLSPRSIVTITIDLKIEEKRMEVRTWKERKGIGREGKRGNKVCRNVTPTYKR